MNEIKEKSSSSFFAKKRGFFLFLLNLFVALFYVLFSLAFEPAVFAERDACAKRFSALGAQADDGCVYTRVISKSDSPQGKWKASEIRNLQGAMNKEYPNIPSFLSLVDSTGVNLPASVQHSTYGDAKSFSVLTLSTFSDTAVFESIDINLYKLVQDERKYGSDANGVVFIPDFYADYLITQSHGVLTSYDDIISGNCLLSLTMGDGTKKVYRACNIFEVNGFYSYGDSAAKDTNGTIIFKHIGSYVFVVDLSLFNQNYSSFDYVGTNSQFVYKKSNEIVQSYANSSLVFSCSYVKNGEVFQDAALSEKTGSIYQKNISVFAGTNIVFLILGCFSFGLFCFLCFYFFPFKLEISCPYFLACSFAGLAIFVFSILSSTCSSSLPLSFLAFSNVGSNVIVLCSFVGLCLFQIFRVKRAK